MIGLIRPLIRPIEIEQRMLERWSFESLSLYGKYRRPIKAEQLSRI